MAKLATLALLSGVTSANGYVEKVREVYMYRATKDPQKSPYVLENVDMADLVGAMKYVHSEVIAEHTIADFDRKLRKYSIDTIGRWRILFQNPGVITGMNQAPMIFADFGPFITFDYGQATNKEPLQLLERLGDFVGAQQNSGAGFVYDDPYFWFSLPGFCPNLPYKCTNGWTDPDQGGGEKCEHDPAIHTAMCLPPTACSDAAKLTGCGACPSKGSRDHPRFIEDNRAKSCTPVPFGTVLQGGLCYPPGAPHTGLTKDVKLMAPAGIPGCVYSYDPSKIEEVKLDDLVGLKDEDCGGRKCKDWYDFRMSCTNQAYKQKFMNTVPPKVVAFNYCVEYDIHPDCARSCTDPACLEVAQDKRELGLPFWRGRCDNIANQKRMEKLASLFGVPGAMDNHQVLQPPSDEFVVQICDRSIDGNHPNGMAKGTLQCLPNTPAGLFGGGPFCTRAWGGVCRTCRIEGTKHAFPDVAQPPCPLDVLKPKEYADKIKTNCRDGACCLSDKPSEKCCLYFDTCFIKLAAASESITATNADGGYKYPLDEELAQLADATMDTAVLLVLLKRVAKEYGNIKESLIEDSASMSRLKEMAYWSWGKAPKVGKADLLEKAKQNVVSIWPDAGPTPPPTAPPAPTPAPPPPPGATPTPAPGAAGDGGGGGGPPWVVIIIILLLLAGGGGAFVMMQKKKRDPLIGGVNERQMT